MEPFFKLLKGKRVMYTLSLAVVTTIIMINSFSDFAEKILKSKSILFFSLVLFYAIVLIILREELWKP